MSKEKSNSSSKDNKDSQEKVEATVPTSKDGINQINQIGSIITKNGDRTIYCITIIGQIEGHFEATPQTKTTKYEHVIPQLVAIEQDPQIDGLLIILNTVGGDVEAGLALSELIAGMNKPTVSLVLGGGHSIGVPLAVSADKSFIVPSASMTVHPVRMTGVMLGVSQTFEYFRRMQERIVGFVSEHSNIDSDRLNKLMLNTGELVMDMGTILEGQDAVDEGLIDYLGSLSDALECLYKMVDKSKSSNSDKSRKASKKVKNK